MQTHKQIAFRNQKRCRLYQKPHKLDRSIDIEEISRPADSTFLKQFLSILHVFNVTTCNDHLEPT